MIVLVIVLGVLFISEKLVCVSCIVCWMVLMCLVSLVSGLRLLVMFDVIGLERFLSVFNELSVLLFNLLGIFLFGVKFIFVFCV